MTNVNRIKVVVLGGPRVGKSGESSFFDFASFPWEERERNSHVFSLIPLSVISFEILTKKKSRLTELTLITELILCETYLLEITKNYNQIITVASSLFYELRLEEGFARRRCAEFNRISIEWTAENKSTGATSISEYENTLWLDVALKSMSVRALIGE